MFRENKNLALVILGVLIVFIYIIFIILVIIAFFEKSKIKYYNSIKNIMRYLLPTLTLTFFGQIFEFLLLIFLCDETQDKNKYNSYECPNNKSLVYAFSVLCPVAILFLLIISFITNSIYYKPTFMNEKSKALTKIDSFPNIIFFINKILFIALSSINSKNPIYIWFMLIVFFISTYINMITFNKYNNYVNTILKEINKFFSLLLFSFIVYLILGKIFNIWGFNGTLHLFFFSIIISLNSVYLNRRNLISFSTKDFKSLNARSEQILYIQNFLNLVNTRHLCREKIIAFDSLVLLREENCIDNNCKLKKYLKSVEKGQPNDFLLFQYCQTLYELSLKKFPDDAIIKINYIIYLMVQMSKRKLAEKVFNTIKFKLFHFEENFMIFCCKKFIETYNNSVENIFKEDNKNVMKRLEYDKLSQEIRSDIIQTTSLYYQFWNVLNKYHVLGIEDYDLLKNIGKQINRLIKGIEEKFEFLQNIKKDDVNLLFLYSGFIKYILGDKIKYEKLNNFLVSITKVDKIKDIEVDYTNFDLKYFEGSDEHKYMVISAEEENLGTILNLSHNAAKIFGYPKQELIGRKLSFLLPYISQKEFETFLKNYTNELKIKFYETISNNKEYIPQIYEFFINAKDKSKYLIPVYIKMLFVQTEESNHAYILTLSYLEDINLNKLKDIFKLGSIFNQNKQKEEKLYKYCIILTDMNFIIQTFTANCQEHLGLNTHSMNSNIDLTLFISEFNDTFYEILIEKRKLLNEKSDKNNIINLEDSYRTERKSKAGIGKLIDISPEEKINCKRYIAEKNYSESKLITWKLDDFENYLVNNKESVLYTNISNNYLKGIDDYNEKLFLLIIQKVEINNKQIGYLFLLRREHLNCIEKGNNLIKSNSKDSKSAHNKNKQNKFLKVHKGKFITFKSSDNLNTKNKIDDSYNNKKDNKDDILSKDIKYSKTHKKIIKMPKSIDIENIKNQEKENIVGLIESKIKNILDEESYKKNSPIKKSSLKVLPSHLSLIGDKNKNIEDIPELLSEKKIMESFLILQNYVTNCNFNFIFDTKLNCYRPSYTLLKAKNFSELLKLEAQKKINIDQILNKKKEKKKKDDSSYCSSDEENESDENEELSYNSESNKSIPKKTIEKTKKQSKAKYDMSKEYYRVSCLNNIKFMIFDFEEEMVVEKENQKGNKSEIENILLNYELKLPTAMDKDSNDPSIRVNKFIFKHSNKDLIKDKFLRMDSSSQIKNAQKVKKREETFKKIKAELNNKEKARVILLFFFLCTFLNIIILGMGAFSLYFIISKLQIFKDYLSIMVYASLLRYYTNLGIYHTRMYSLIKLNISEGPYSIYNNNDIQQNRTKYFENLYEKLQNDFFKGSDYLEKVIAINIKLSKHNENKLYSNSFNNTLMGSAFSTKNVSSSYMVGISQIYSHFYYLISNIERLEYNSPEFLNFMLNALNNAGIGTNEIINVYLDEIQNNKSNHVKIAYIIISIYFILLILIFFLIKINYAYMIFKRDNYISTFYQINLSYISSSIMKCEKYLNQINPNEFTSNENEKKITPDNSISDYDDNLLSIEPVKKNRDTNSLIRKQNIKNKGNKILIFLFICFLTIIFLYMFIPLIEFNEYLSKFEIMALYMYHMIHYHNNIINSYNAFNEFLFYNYSNIENIPVLDFLNKTANSIYDTLTADLSYLGTNSTQVSGLYEVFSKVQKEQLCNITLCDPYIEKITSLGFFSFAFFMVTEIKVKVNYVKILTERKAEYLSSAGEVGRALILFNNIHYDVDIMFNLVALHYIENEIILSVEKIMENINSRNGIYIAIFTVFFILIILIYLFYWTPFIIKAQEQIYEAKETLNIIPLEILDSQTNIKNILGISDLN